MIASGHQTASTPVARGTRAFPWELALLRAVGVLLAATVVALGWPGLGLAGRPGVRSGMLAVEAMLVAYAMLARRGLRGEPRLHRAWLGVVSAFGLWLASDLVWFALGSPPLSIADIGYSVFFPLVTWGVLSFPTRIERGRTRFWLDTGIVVAAGATIVWYFVLAPAAESGFEATLSGAINLGYPVGDVVLLFGACALLLREPLAGGRRALAWIAAGTLAQFAGDLLYGIASLDESYVSGSATDVLWVLGYWSIAMAMAEHRRWAAQEASAAGAASAGAPEPAAQRRPLLTVLLPYVAMAVAYATLAHATIRAAAHAGMALTGVLIGTALVLTLTAARQVQAMRENATLERERAMRAGDDRLSALVRHSADVLLVVSAEGRVRFASPATQALFGVAPERLIGEALGDAVRADDAADVELLLAAARESGTGRAVWRLRPSAEAAAAVAEGAPAAPIRFAEVVGTDLRHEPTVDGIVLNVARRHRAHRARGTAHAPGLPRPAHRAGEPRAVPRPGGRRAGARATAHAQPARAVPRPRRLQDRQRQPRPRGGRPAAGGGGGAPAQARRAAATRWRGSAATSSRCWWTA